MGNDRQLGNKAEAERVMAQDWGWGLDENRDFKVIDHDKYNAFQATAHEASYKCPHCGKRPAGWQSVTGRGYKGAFYRGTNKVCIDCTQIASERKRQKRAQDQTPRRKRRTKAEIEADKAAAKEKEERALRMRLASMVADREATDSAESGTEFESPVSSPAASPSPLANQDAIMARFELMEQKILDLQKVNAHLVNENNKLNKRVTELEAKQPTHRPPPLAPLLEKVDKLTEKLDIACGEMDSMREEIESLQVEAPRFVETNEPDCPWPIKVEPEEPNAMKYLFTDDVDPHREEEPVPPEDEENLSNDAQTRRIQKEMNEDKWEFRLPKRSEMGKGEYDFSHLSLPKTLIAGM